VFLDHCRRVLALLEAAPAANRRAADGRSGTLRLAFTAIGAYAVLADVLKPADAHLHDAAVELTELVSPDQFTALSELRIDMGLVHPPIPEQYESVLVHSEDLVLAVPAAHALATAAGPITLAEVTDEYIGYSPEGSRYLHDICAAMIGVNRYAISQLTSQVPTMPALVRAGLGCALVPRSIMTMGVHGVRYRDLAAADAHSVTLHACWSPDSPNPVLRRLADVLRTSGFAVSPPALPDPSPLPSAQDLPAQMPQGRRRTLRTGRRPPDRAVSTLVTGCQATI
jgi:DNA-binding transcriptional LysR family regulator